MESYNNLLISSATAFLAEKNELLETATASYNLANKLVKDAHDEIMTSTSVKQAEAALQQTQLKNDAEREEISKHARNPRAPESREMHFRHSELIQLAMKHIHDTKTAGLNSHTFKKLTDDSAQALVLLREATKAKIEAASFVGIFTAVCKSAAKAAEVAVQDEMNAKPLEVRVVWEPSLATILAVLITFISIAAFIAFSDNSTSSYKRLSY